MTQVVVLTLTNLGSLKRLIVKSSAGHLAEQQVANRQEKPTKSGFQAGQEGMKAKPSGWKPPSDLMINQ